TSSPRTGALSPRTSTAIRSACSVRRSTWITRPSNGQASPSPTSRIRTPSNKAAGPFRMRILLAGSTGVIGRPLLTLPARAGHTVTGTARAAARAPIISDAGATPAVVDVFDAAALREVARAARPEVVIHQLTDLPEEPDPGKIAASLAANARIRIEGTPNLIAAAKAAGARRMIAQSIAFAYAPGPEPRAETDPL